MADYIFDLITKSGDDISDAGNLVSIGETPSINNLGSVAFIGKFGTGFNPPRDLLVADSLEILPIYLVLIPGDLAIEFKSTTITEFLLETLPLLNKY